MKVKGLHYALTFAHVRRNAVGGTVISGESDMRRLGSSWIGHPEISSHSLPGRQVDPVLTVII